ncbi:DUF4397 domain-containing protein [Hymenobacter sp. 5317J-9]|uniref:DUF4397 domain-containing protein n=1 Tax=Hymenobacter sp. 5317J-9 TaxID=2932250 RepID=UPI001FD6FC3B|nr:DUF4397 domain-containing protein [Hymenobacter sp. 5317J-9]UOQ98401.1 DUF4397 domain-containing protein [Hymenobacter sp. 5317J-9]
MKTSFASLAFRALLPAAVLLASCSKKDEPVAPVVEQGQVKFHHAAPSANLDVKFLADDAEKATLAYGANSGYQGVPAGSRTLKVNVATSGQNAVTQSVAVEKDKNYSYFAYSPGATTAVSGLFVNDDLTTPASGKAKIRLVHLGQGQASPLRLTQRLAVGSQAITADVPFGTASPFVEINAGTYNIDVSAGNPSVAVLYVAEGNGSGSTTASKNYESGKIYTVLVRGYTSLDPNLAPKVVLIQNN